MPVSHSPGIAQHRRRQQQQLVAQTSNFPIPELFVQEPWQE